MHVHVILMHVKILRHQRIHTGEKPRTLIYFIIDVYVYMFLNQENVMKVNNLQVYYKWCHRNCHEIA